jgi:hypothetical protein
MYFLEDSQGNVVRALDWTGENLILLLRHDTDRVESCSTTEYFDRENIGYTVLETLNKSAFNKSGSHLIQNLNGRLKVVREADSVLKNIDLPKDDEKKFNAVLKKTSITGIGIALLLFIFGLFIHPETQIVQDEPQVVVVMDRKQLEKEIILPPVRHEMKISKPVAKITRPVVKRPVARLQKKATLTQQSGVLGVLGSLTNSKQRGGLNLNQAETSAGIGRGGLEGSGGVQTAVYSKGMFSAPLGIGGKAQGAGGYGTKGKGGGRAGYGKVSLVGSSDAFFEPVESETWVEGGLDRNEIAAVIQRHLSEVRYCYEQGLQQKPALAGRLSMKFMIGPQGSVTLAQVSNSSLRHVPVENCIRDHLKTWNFPQPQGGVTVKVNYPFILRRVSDS